MRKTSLKTWLSNPAARWKTVYELIFMQGCPRNGENQEALNFNWRTQENNFMEKTAKNTDLQEILFRKDDELNQCIYCQCSNFWNNNYCNYNIFGKTQRFDYSNQGFTRRPGSNVGSSKNLGRATFRKMPEAGLKIAQKGLKNTFFCQNFAEAPSLARVWVG